MNSSTTLAKRLTIARTHKNMNVRSLALKVNVSPQTIANIENELTKNPKMDLIIKICHVLNITYDWFLEEKGNMTVTKLESDHEKRANSLQIEVNLLNKQTDALQQMINFQAEKIKVLEKQLSEK